MPQRTIACSLPPPHPFLFLCCSFTAMAAYLQSTYGGNTPTFAYSVGNEPDLWRVNHVSAPQLARDAVTLVNTLKNYNIGKEVYGPSWAGVSESDATQFLPIAAAGGVTGYTVHNYPYGGKDCNVSAYLQKGPVTEHLASNLAKVRAVADASAPNMLLVLEEVAGSSGGGCDNVTDRFVAGFAWLNTLATVGASGFHRVHRQDIAGWSFAFGKSNYMLMGPPGWVNGSHDLLTPHPDYYTTLLWKQLVGQRVLNTTLGEGTDYLSASVWCAAPGAPYGSGAGSTVLAWTNSAPTPATVALPPQLAAASSTSFLLTGAPTPQGAFAELQSDDMYLNGALLSVAGDGSLLNYPYVGLQAQPAAQVEAPPFSYGFLVFDSTDVPACIF
jgi:heparanase 1